MFKKKFTFKFIKKRNALQNSSYEIQPDEIFLDSSNLPDFNTNQFEGRLEKPITKNGIMVIGFVFIIIGFIFIGRLYVLQGIKGEALAIASENNRLRTQPIFSERGLIYDRNNVELAWNIPNDNESFAERHYFDGQGLSHVLGYVNYPTRDSSNVFYREDFEGRDGIEKVFNKHLSGENGLIIIEADALQRVQSSSVIRPPKGGKNINLSIDSRVQEKLYAIIQDLAHDVDFKGGAGLIMDVNTGELIALTSYPEFSSQVLTNENTQSAVDNYLNDESTPFLNRAVSGLYTPGSIVKPFVALAALTEKIISPTRQILSTGKLVVPNPYEPSKPSIFVDWKAHGLVDMQEALAMSSNVYFYQIGGGFGTQPGLGITRINEYMHKFGFGKTTGIALSNEPDGIIPSPKWKQEQFDGEDWRLGDTYNTAIGQYGFQVTPLQVVRAVGGLANGGKLKHPTLRSEEDTKAQVERVFDVSQTDLKIVQKGMRQAVLDGTAKGLNMSKVHIAAKTGTAQIGVSKKRVNSWVIGFFPYEKPKYAFTILMERGPEHNLYGGVFVMRTLLDWMVINTPEYFE